MLQSTADQPTRPQAARGLEDQLQKLTRSAADYAAVALQPIRDLVQGQRDFADHMTRWAELQRDMADNMASWAAQQREYADTLDGRIPALAAHPVAHGRAILRFA